MAGPVACINPNRSRSSRAIRPYDQVHQRPLNENCTTGKDYSKEKKRKEFVANNLISSEFSLENRVVLFALLSYFKNKTSHSRIELDFYQKPQHACSLDIFDSEESNINQSPEDSCQRDLNDKGSHSSEVEGKSAVAPKVTDNTPNSEENLQPEKDNPTAHSEYNAALRNENIDIPTIAENKHIASNCKPQNQDLNQFVSSASEEKLITTPSKRSPQQTPLIDRVGRVADTQLDACGHELQKEKIRTKQQNVPEEMRSESKELNQVQGDHSDLPTRDKPYEISVKTMAKQKPPDNGGCTKADLLENVINVTISAKEANNFKQIEHCAALVRENIGEFLCSSSLKSCEAKFFLRYLQCCGLDDLEKLVLILARLSSRVEENDAASKVQEFDTSKEELEIMKTAILSASNHPKAHGLTTHILKQQLSFQNCVSVALWSCRVVGLLKLNIFAEFCTMENFEDVNEHFSRLSVPIEHFLQYFEISSIPHDILHFMIDSFLKRHTTKLSDFHRQRIWKRLSDLKDGLNRERGYVPGITTDEECLDQESQISKMDCCAARDQVHEMLRMEWLLSKLCKLKTVKTQTIGPKGGVLQINGCSLTFPAGAVKENTDVTISLDTNPTDLPENGVAIAPILGVKPSRKFEKSVIVRMRTFFRKPADKDVCATIMCKTSGSVWKPASGNPDVPVSDDFELQFEMDHFCKIRPIIPETVNSPFSVKNEIFIRQVTGSITSCFYIDDADILGIREGMEYHKSFSFCPRTLEIDDCKRSDELIVNLTLTTPKEEPSRWKLSDRVPVKNITGRSGNGKYSIQTIPRDINSLTNLTYVTADYEVRIGDELKEAADLSSEWPVKPHPSRAPMQIMVQTWASDNAKVNQTNTNTKTYMTA